MALVLVLVLVLFASEPFTQHPPSAQLLSCPSSQRGKAHLFACVRVYNCEVE